MTNKEDYNINEEYKKEYYEGRMAFKEIVYPSMGKLFQDILMPKNIIDVGCGHGILMDGFSCPCVGIEGSDAGFQKTKDRGYEVYQFDLRQRLKFNRKFDLAISIEVAEHLEERYADCFIDNLLSLSDRILLTASPIAGKYHYNPQPKKYWIGKFESKGVKLNSLTNDIVKVMQKQIPKERDYLYNNLMYFTK